MILSADLHLTDKAQDEYRWAVFERLRVHADGQVFILGDLADRADRHSSRLVNRLIDELTALAREHTVTILCGNHDRPLLGPPYFSFLNQLKGVSFITQPEGRGDLLLLPYSPDPRTEWAEIDFTAYRGVFMHQTVSGATVGDRVLENDRMVAFAAGNRVYSGDIHVPQQVGPVTYVGAPHPIKFNDGYRTRFLILDQHYEIEREVTLRRMRKRILEISDISQLEFTPIAPGDQARIRFTLSAAEMARWPAMQTSIALWAQDHGVQLASVEAIIENAPNYTPYTFDSDPKEILKSYCQAEGIGAELYQAALALLQSHLE